MKLEKMNKNQVALATDMMSKVTGGAKVIRGIEVGTTRFTYCNGGSAATFGTASSDRVTETWTEDAITGGGFWSTGGSCSYADR